MNIFMSIISVMKNTIEVLNSKQETHNKRVRSNPEKGCS